MASGSPAEAAPSGESLRVSVDRLTGFAAGLLAACGMGEARARDAAALVVEADLIGAHTHGVIRLPQYIEWLRGGHVNPDANIRVAMREGGTALIDGDNGFGHLVVAEAARTAIEMAREQGVAWVGTRASNHAGAGGIYAAMPVAHDMVGIYAAVSSANHMAIWGAAEPRLGTNPIAVGIPAGQEPPIVLDIATSVSSFGAIRKHALEGQAIPEGWMAKRGEGTPITDPARAAEGFLLPIGGHKGSGLALIIGLLAGVLNGASFGEEVRRFSAAVSQPSNTGQFVIALNVARFMDIGAFKAAIDGHMRALRGAERLPDVAAIRLPGDARARRRQSQIADGVELSAALTGQLDGLAAALDLPPLSRG